MLKKIGKIILSIVLIGLYYYLFLPPINLSSMAFWMFIFYAIFMIAFCNLINWEKSFRTNRFHSKDYISCFYVLLAIPIILLGIMIVNFVCSPIFNANTYANRITVLEDQSFQEGVKEVDFNKIPLLDKDSSAKLGDRQMGQKTDWVSQFYVSDLYTQINYNNEIIRVTPLEYVDIIKYFNNRKEGIKGYIRVNSVDGTSDLIELNKGMQYLPSAYFNEDLYRKLRFTYPTLIFEEESFEIDNEGNPYWIIPYVSYRGVGLKKEIEGIIIFDPITGQSTKYSVSEVPAWVDHVYPSYLIIEKLDDWGQYKRGFLNSIFGQQNVVMTTDGYNYLIQDDDVYLYTGITSVATDESNVGFVLSNLRTGTTHFYDAPGAEEYSAAASAEGLVQEKGYKATFPLLINLNGRPTYLMSLKDNAGLVKMYAFVDVIDYQKVSTSESSLSIGEAAAKYQSESKLTQSILHTKNIIIDKVVSAVISGNTNYFLSTTEGENYQIDISKNPLMLPFLKKEDRIEITYDDNNIIHSIKKLS